jgi:hypothetical protein
MSASATPAPNDHTELAQHAAFLGVMTRAEMLVRWFINDSNDTKAWRLKGHAVAPFFDWMASWARMAEHPRDLGDDLPGFDLAAAHDRSATGPTRRRWRPRARCSPPRPRSRDDAARHQAADHRRPRRRRGALVDAEARFEPWIIWCDTDYEADALRVALDACALARAIAEVRGSHPVEQKERHLAAFAAGTVSVLVSKPSVCGFGLNWQHCARMAFVGRSFSYEAWYQAVRRCYRFGQQRPGSRASHRRRGGRRHRARHRPQGRRPRRHQGRDGGRDAARRRSRVLASDGLPADL